MVGGLLHPVNAHLVVNGPLTIQMVSHDYRWLETCVVGLPGHLLEENSHDFRQTTEKIKIPTICGEGLLFTSFFVNLRKMRVTVAKMVRLVNNHQSFVLKLLITVN